MATATLDAVEQSKKLASAAQRKAKRIASDQAVNPSTRTRHALKVKADALDQIQRVLQGKH